jgi:GxxExxY protein
MKENEITKIIIECAIEVHRTLGPGLLESVYEEALLWELRKRGLIVVRQVIVPITYKGHTLGHPLKVDLLVHRTVIVECKVVLQDIRVFQAQLLTYLRITGLKVGLLLNFGQRLMKDGIHRVVNGL